MARPHAGTDIFSALAHPSRRKALELLARDEMTAGELAAALKITQASMSEHLSTLRATGLATYRSRGNQHVYALARPKLKPMEDWIARMNRGR